MHTLLPFERWLLHYDSNEDDQSPFAGKEYNYDQYSENIYGYYIDPAWDSFGSETLYIKLLYVNYEIGLGVIEFIGEWNDAINNDVMNLKREIIEHMSYQGINKFMLMGENILNFHGSDDAYYEEWFNEVEDADPGRVPGWIAAVNFPTHVIEEMQKYNIDNYINMAGSLQIEKWRTLAPLKFYEFVDGLIQRRLGA
jgi:hypothetical protein